MKIPLSQGKFAIVGPRDYAYLMQWKWYYLHGYAARNGFNSQVVYMHRAILERMGFKDFEDSDHINRDKSDNYRRNLRAATRRQNLCNRGRRRDNTSGYIGVGWKKQYKKWQAQIKANCKLKHLGYFDDKKEAAKAYNKAARKYHGKFATLNEV